MNRLSSNVTGAVFDNIYEFSSFLKFCYLNMNISPSVKMLGINKLLSTTKCTFNFEDNFGMDQ